jgi:DNA (cytosine-5)-methyltransferase 1
MPKPKLMCPTHQERLMACHTRYGVRMACPVDGCTVACWDGATSTPADQETRDARIAAHKEHENNERCERAVNVAVHPTIYHADVCAGSGMLGLGVKLALGGGMRTVVYVEREAYAAGTLVARMEDAAVDPAPVWDCVESLTDPEFLGYVRRFRPLVVTAGYPCQPFSCAGKRLGERDARHLWPRIDEFIGAAKPECVFLENVPGHLRMGFGQVRRDLEGRGYRVAQGLFSAEEVGASHRRLRLFILAVSEQSSVCAQQFDKAGEWADCSEVDESMFGVASTTVGHAASDHEQRDSMSGAHGEGITPRRSSGLMADAESTNGRTREQGQQGQWWRGSGGDNCELADTSGECERKSDGETGPESWGGPRRLSGGRGGGNGLPLFAPGPGELVAWRDIIDLTPGLEPATERELCRTPHGLAYRLDADRLRCTGNGVVPLVAAYAFVSLWAALAAHTQGKC